MLRRSYIQIGIALITLATCQTATAQNLAVRDPPSFERIVEITRRHFLEIRGFNEDQLLVESEVRDFLPQLRQLGWWSFPWRRVPCYSLADDEFIVSLVYRKHPPVELPTCLTAPERIYNRMDRLSYSPVGRILLLELAERENFYALLQQDPAKLCEESQILSPQEVAVTLEQLQIDEPTGRVYTLKQFLESLRVAYRTDD